MTTEESTKKKAAKKKPASSPAPRRKKRGGDSGSDTSESTPRASGLTGRQSLALWELVLKGDGRPVSKRSVKLKPAEVSGLASAGMVTIVSGRGKDPARGAKMFLTDAAWDWANHDGLVARLSRSRLAASLMEMLLSKVGSYLDVHKLALDHLLRPRRPDVEIEDAAARSSGEAGAEAPHQAHAVAGDMEQRIRAAYLRVTKGALNEHVRLAHLRAELPGEAVDAVDAELRAMQQRGNAVLYPIDDPQVTGAEDNAAAIQVYGERRDLLCIME